MYKAANDGDLKFYSFPHFESTCLVAHGFTTRAGGVSEGPYAGLNTAFHVGDRPENVQTNRALACRALGINPDHLVAGEQVHSDLVRLVEQRDRGRGAHSGEEALPVTDALVTGVKGLPLSSYYADCVPIFFLDPVRKVVALAHAGWKGTALKIGLKTVKRMAEVFGSNPVNCLAGLGPSIGPCCYEVDLQVARCFQENFSDFQEIAAETSPGKWPLDLWEANRRTLMEAGLKEENVIASRVCTSCNNGLFFSYRAQGGMAGRMAALIMLK